MAKKKGNSYYYAHAAKVTDDIPAPPPLEGGVRLPNAPPSLNDLDDEPIVTAKGACVRAGSVVTLNR